MNQSITLRPLADEDLLLMKRWLSLPHVAAWYHHPLAWLDEMEHRNDTFSFVHHFIAEHEGMPIGFGQYYEYRLSGEDWHGDTPLDGTYSIDYLIGENGFLGNGFGKAIIRSLVLKIKALPTAKRIIVQPEPDNLASCNALRANGFSFEETGAYYLLFW